MNNWIGLLIALSLALVAGVLNWQYLERKTEEVEMVAFVSVKQGTTIEPGDRFLEEHFVPLNIPKKSVGSLEESAVLYQDRHTVISMKAINRHRSGQVVLRQELRSPPKKLNIGPNEEGFWVPVGGSTFVSSLFSPGDMVSFLLPAPRKVSFRNRTPAPVKTESEDPNEQWKFDSDASEVEVNQGPSDVVGPFRIISVGARLGSSKVSRAAGGRSSAENTLGVAVVRTSDGKRDAKGKLLIERVLAPGFRHAGVLLHSKPKTPQ